MKKQLNSHGFTNIELVVVIIIIFLLFGVLAFAYNGVEDKNNNSRRVTAINAIQRQLEAFYQDNNYYPSLRDMNDSAWLNSNLKSLDLDLLKDPKAKDSTLSSTPAEHQYSYSPADNSGKPCEEEDKQCSTYSLTASLAGGDEYSKQNSN